MKFGFRRLGGGKKKKSSVGSETGKGSAPSAGNSATKVKSGRRRAGSKRGMPKSPRSLSSPLGTISENDPVTQGTASTTVMSKLSVVTDGNDNTEIVYGEVSKQLQFEDIWKETDKSAAVEERQLSNPARLTLP